MHSECDCRREKKPSAFQEGHFEVSGDGRKKQGPFPLCSHCGEPGSGGLEGTFTDRWISQRLSEKEIHPC